MTRIRVPIVGGNNKSVLINSAATAGAQLGLNFLMPDGSLATAAKIAAFLGVTPNPPNKSPNVSTVSVLWTHIIGIPNNVLQPPFNDDSAQPGADGDAIPGPRGLQGVPGIGIPGDDGYVGSDGDPGPPGAAGAASVVPGPQGPPGAPIPADDGRDGYDGDPVPGPPGAASTIPGPAGAAGVIGAPGTDGADGADGDHIPGPPGAAGQASIVIPGDDGAPGMDGDCIPAPLPLPPAAFIQSYTPGPLSIPSGFFMQAAKRQQWTGTQRLILSGTARLSIGN